MTRALSATIVSPVLITVAHVLAEPGGGALPALGVGALAGFAYALGAWCAPLFSADGPFGGSILGGWHRHWDAPKSAQILFGGVATAAFVVLGLFETGSAAIFGIAVALAVGAFLPVGEDDAPAHAADSQDARCP